MANGEKIDLETYSLPEAMDWNEDGLIDLILCGLNGSNPNVLLYINKGTAANYKFGAPEYIQSDGKDLKLSSPHTPHVIDFNGDGKKDLMIGTKDGKIAYYENRGSNSNPDLAAAVYLVNGPDDNEVFVEKTWTGTSSPEAKPHFCDWNKDGRWDIIMGGGKAVMDMFISYGTGKESTVTTATPVDPVGVTLVESAKGIELTNYLHSAVSLTIHRANGAVVSATAVLQAGRSCSLESSLAQGIYFVHIHNESYKKIYKFIVR